MADELVNVYSRFGKNKGTEKISLVHSNGHWHEAIHAYIFYKGKILIQQRASTKYLYKDMWDCSFAGHVDIGETPVDTTIRECKEELGIDISKNCIAFGGKYREYIKYPNAKNKEFIYVYFIEKDVKLKDITLQKEEVSNVKWIKIEDYLNKIKNRDKTFLIHKKIEYKLLKMIAKM